MNPNAVADPPVGADLLQLDRQLCFALYSASLAMTRLYKPLLDPLGLTYPQYLALMALWEADDVTVSALGARLQLDSGTLTPLLKRLESAGWVARQRDSADERRVRLRVTPAGQALKARAAAVPPQIACAAGRDLDELAGLTTRLQALRASLRQPAPAVAV